MAQKYFLKFIFKKKDFKFKSNSIFSPKAQNYADYYV